MKLFNFHFVASVTLIFLLAFKCGRSTTIIEPSYEMEFGQWLNWGDCSPGTFAYAFQLKADQPSQSFRDDVGMTGIKLFCHDHEKIEEGAAASQDSPTGYWKDKQSCPPGQWINGFRLRVEKYLGWVQDDTAANDLEMVCDDSKILPGGGTSDGSWLDWVNCTNDEFICGVQTKIENKAFTDRLGLVSLKMKCCSLSEFNNITKSVGNAATNSSTTSANELTQNSTQTYSPGAREMPETVTKSTLLATAGSNGPESSSTISPTSVGTTTTNLEAERDAANELTTGKGPAGDSGEEKPAEVPIILPTK